MHGVPWHFNFKNLKMIRKTGIVDLDEETIETVYKRMIANRQKYHKKEKQ